ncbi:unnamed protein product [Blepharisma stoltei]|uniref:Dolichol-phosphate mannosyltransferase subunit 3 n=1 Tax=Blepharisma stoltei TaxID=1481888 RepID=A0AAU9JF81_9CILI|nr:unnamed protein product [Blepharisma stoltei]
MLNLLGIKCSRGTKLIFNFILVTALWWYCMNLEIGSNFHFTVSAFPYWCLIAFGCKALISIGYDLFALRDCPEEAASLHKELEDARIFLSKKGLKL